MLRSVGTGSEGLTISPWLQVAFLLTSAQHCVVLLFVACLPFLRNVRRCRGAACCHCCREMPTVHGHSSSHGDILSVGGKRSRWEKCFSSPGLRYSQCWLQTRPLAEVLFQPGSETSSLLAANASVSRTQHTVFRALGTSLECNLFLCPIDTRLLVPPLALVIWAFPWCPSGTEVSETRHSLIVLMFVLRGRPNAQSFAIVLTLPSKQKHPHFR